jgi:SAM-dependent methyltransferase
MWKRLVKRVIDAGRGRSYWDRRRHFNYYTHVVRLAEQHAPRGGQVIDVGVYQSDVLGRLPWFQRRVALDLLPIPPQEGIEVVQMDFMQYRPDAAFDLVLCLQVLEHLDEPEPFAQKLMRTGRTVIISVPYKWPRGQCRNHVQDPVDETKLALWTGREPVESCVAADGRERLIAVYQTTSVEPLVSADREQGRADCNGTGIDTLR